jgi:hypothetical protein
MITIKTLDNNKAELRIDKGTPNTTILLGVEMLVEYIVNSNDLMDIDFVLNELKRIYLRDNEVKDE